MIMGVHSVMRSVNDLNQKAEKYRASILGYTNSLDCLKMLVETKGE